MEQKDYYDMLGLPKDAGPKDIRDAYRRLALQHHPDRNRDNPGALDRMKQINEAYAVLSDPAKRREYDTIRQAYGSSSYDQFRRTHSDQDIFRDSDIRQIFEELSRAFGYRSFEDVFKESYGAGYRTFEFRRPGAFGRIIISGFGGAQAPGKSTAPTGYLEKTIRYILKKKWGIELPERGSDVMDFITISPDLAQHGGKTPYFCSKAEKKLLVKVPPNTRPGQRLRLKGMGEPGRGGGEPGDLFLKVNIGTSLLEKAKGLIARVGTYLKSK